MADAPTRIWLYRWRHGLAWGGGEKGSDPYNPWRVETDPRAANLLQNPPQGWDLWEVVEYQPVAAQVEKPCPSCEGTGWDGEGHSRIPCPVCEGTGYGTKGLDDHREGAVADSAIEVGRCPRCLRPREGNPDPELGLSFAPPCPHCGLDRIPERAPILRVWICPYCLKQYEGPHGHHVAGDRSATGCFHAHPGEDGVVQPRLVRIEVQPAEPFEPREIPHDRRPSEHRKGKR